MDTAKKQNHPNQAHADERRKLRIEYENAEPENRRDNTDDIAKMPTVLIPRDNVLEGEHHDGENRRQRKKFKNK
nr:hypothetical protein [Bifidobacterium dentium]